MLDAIKLSPKKLYEPVRKVAGEELVEVLQIENKTPRRKALLSLEESIISILSEGLYQ